MKLWSFKEALLRYMNKPKEGKQMVCGKEGRKDMGIGSGKQRWRLESVLLLHVFFQWVQTPVQGTVHTC